MNEVYEKNFDRPSYFYLWATLDELGLIILQSTNIFYSNQVGGHACLHPVVEGAFLLLHKKSYKLCDYFGGPKWNGWCYKGIDEETADFVDSFLKEFFLPCFLKVDRSCLKDSYEAWIYVDIYRDEPDLFENISPAKGVLTW